MPALESKTITIGTREYKIKLWHDQDCRSPIEDECDNGVFITYASGSRNWQYGNTPLDEDAHQLIGRRIQLYQDPDGAKALALANALAEAEEEELGEPLIGLPVYVYEHGSVAIRTEAFSCPWDSGQSGFIYVTEKTALEWQGVKRMTKDVLAKMHKSLGLIIDEYSKWCNGECYYYTIEDKGGEELDSCGGFIGWEYAMQEAESAVPHAHKTVLGNERDARTLRNREARERLYWACRDVVTA